jgi:hypothetical protein
MKRTLTSRKAKTSPARATASRPGAAPDSAANFKGPNTHKKYRKPDEIYGDVSIPDSARKE